MAERGIYLIGFSGSGKSTIAGLVGALMGCPAYDLDTVIVERSGMIIPTIFKLEGEAGFRLREAEALRALASGGRFVVATGAGAAVQTENRRFMESHGWIIALEGRPEILHARIQQQLERAEPGAIRPMLDAVYPLEQVRALKHSRQASYALAHWTVHTDRLTPEQVAAEVVRAVAILEQAPEPSLAPDSLTWPLRHSLEPDLPPPVVITAGPLPYQVIVGWQSLARLGAQVQRLQPRAHRVAVLTEPQIWHKLGDTVSQSLQAAGLEVYVHALPPDERAKTLGEAAAIYDWLLDVQLRRDDIVLVVGGGAVDDVASFAASTFMRGVPLVKVPTSLEGMIDSAIGGKTALNHPRMANLVGSFYQPRLVWADASLLAEEPERERHAALAEVVKYAMLERSLLPGDAGGPALFEQLEASVDALLGMERATLLPIMARCVALKAQVVNADERDLGQQRILLNYGHTVAHALQTASDYAILHGEAVAIGMTFAARLALRLGLAAETVEVRQSALLARLGLPTRLPRVSCAALLEHIHRDKKVFGDAQRWVLPTAIGRVRVHSGVPQEELTATLAELSEEPLF